MGFSVVVLVVGAIFVLIGLIGGGIKIGVKEGEASIPILSLTARILAIVIGACFIFIGLWREVNPQSPSSPNSLVSDPTLPATFEIPQPESYRIIDVKWCQTQDQKVLVEGRLIDKNRVGVSDEDLQLKIFPEGGGDYSNLEEAVSTTTAADGQISAEIQQSHDWSVVGDRYVINFVIFYQDSSGQEMHRKLDFKKGKPVACTQTP